MLITLPIIVQCKRSFTVVIAFLDAGCHSGIEIQSISISFFGLLSFSPGYSCINMCGGVRENRQKNDKNPFFVHILIISPLN